MSLMLPENWKHCSGKENPPDHVTCGMSARALQWEALWWHRPKWLKDSMQTRETEPHVINENDDVMEYVAQNIMTDPHCTVSLLFDLNRYSGLNRVLRITA